MVGLILWATERSLRVRRERIIEGLADWGKRREWHRRGRWRWLLILMMRVIEYCTLFSEVLLVASLISILKHSIITRLPLKLDRDMPLWARKPHLFFWSFNNFLYDFDWVYALLIWDYYCLILLLFVEFLFRLLIEVIQSWVDFDWIRNFVWILSSILETKFQRFQGISSCYGLWLCCYLVNQLYVLMGHYLLYLLDYFYWV